MPRPTAPPPFEFFDRDRPAGGDGRAAIAIGPIEIELRGLEASLARTLDERFAPFSADRGTSSDALRVELRMAERDYFIEPPARPEINPVLIACDGDRVRFLGYRLAGWFETAGPRGAAVLAQGSYEPPERALENYIRAAVAWRAASRGGALVHSASAVLNGRGYLFFGPSGVDKSTLSACNRRARIVSDDLSLVLPGADGALDLVGSPFRGTYEGGGPVTGRFPLRAGFRLFQAPRAEVRPAARVRALSELVGNLPFVAEAFARRPDLFAGVERAFAGVPLAHLHFARDESYWDAIESAGYTA